MSLDLSPEGTTVVFDLLGDLYTLPVTGGEARPLTVGMAFDAQPRFSPDGRRIAFISDRSGVPNLWIMNRDGTGLRRLSDLRSISFGSVIASPAWSPDGRAVIVSQKLAAVERVAADRSHCGGLHGERWLLAEYAVDSRVTRMRWISDTAASGARQMLGATFTPDGHTIYAAVKPHACTGALPVWRIGSIERTTGTLTPEMVSFIGRDGMRPVVSPDGRYLAYVSSTGSRFGLRLRDVNQLTERWLVRERMDLIGHPHHTRDLAPGYAFTRDSKHLIMAFDGKFHRIALEDGATAPIPFRVRVERRLAPMTVRQSPLPNGRQRVRGVMHPALSPDGSRVVFSAFNHLWIMPVSLGARGPSLPVRVTSESAGEFYPSWSPDGAWLVYSAWWDGAGGEVRRIRFADLKRGGTARSERVSADTALYFHTAVSPDGDRIVAVRAPLPPERVLTHSLANTVTQWITDTGSAPITLVWFPMDGGGMPSPIPVELARAFGDTPRVPVEQVYFTTDPSRIFVGLTSFRWDGNDRRVELAPLPDSTVRAEQRDLTGVFAPSQRRVLLDRSYALIEASPASHPDQAASALDVDRALQRPIGAPAGAASRWGRVLAPWISWSQDGRRVLFNQGGTLFVGDVVPGAWTSFRAVEVPLSFAVDSSRGTILLRGARLVTMRQSAVGHAEVIERGDLLVRDGRIADIGRSGTVPLPPGAHILDVAGMTILPGYVDIHDHFAAAYGVMPGNCWVCRVVLAAGVTASRSASDHEFTYSSILTLAERERAGDLIGPRLFATGVPNFGWDRPVRTLEDARAVVAPIAQYFDAGTFKEYDGRATRQARQLVARAAQAGGLNATIHVSGLEWGLSAIVDGFSGVEHPLTLSGALYDDVLTFVALSGVTQTMTYSIEVSPWHYLTRRMMSPSEATWLLRFVPPSAQAGWAPLTIVGERDATDLDILRRITSSAAGIVKRDGRVGMGSHGAFPGLGFHYEMWLHAVGGMTNSEILQSATIAGARAIGFDQALGSLDRGKAADLQILSRNPLEDIRNTVTIRHVMKNGRLYAVDTMTEVWPRTGSD